MKFRALFLSFFLLLAVFGLSACEKKKVGPIPPVDVIEELPNGQPSEPPAGKISGDLPGNDSLKVLSPAMDAVVVAPLVVKGEAKGSWYWEASFPIRLLDDQGKELAVVPAQAQGEWMTEAFVPFEATFISFDPGKATSGTLVFQKDNPSGLPEYDQSFELPVRFLTGETSTVKLYFPNTVKDPEMLDCGKVFMVERVIPKTPTVARATIDELLKGPTEAEKNDGFITSLNSGVKVQRLVVENGVAEVDFDEQLQFQVGGSCRIQSIRAQIRETLMQFPTVNDVVISIDGETEEILQP
jgi:hypothetical protein